MKSSLFLIVLLWFSTFANADEIQGKVVGITDGDTITVLDADKVQHKIRLKGIDAPESKQAFGTESKQKMSELVGEKEVVLKWSKKLLHPSRESHISTSVDAKMIRGYFFR